ncbi:hypothetical protein ABAC402_02055 [Asticcacaulis sp. AC402]|nr:hypothetical protein ABAC402_02055 [Asticcacaulis sp. AC402]
MNIPALRPHRYDRKNKNLNVQLLLLPRAMGSGVAGAMASKRKSKIVALAAGGAQPDVVWRQEREAPDGNFPAKAQEAAGYGTIWHGQTLWDGVAQSPGRSPCPKLGKDQRPCAGLDRA